MFWISPLGKVLVSFHRIRPREQMAPPWPARPLTSFVLLPMLLSLESQYLQRSNHPAYLPFLARYELLLFLFVHARQA